MEQNQKVSTLHNRPTELFSSNDGTENKTCLLSAIIRRDKHY